MTGVLSANVKISGDCASDTDVGVCVINKDIVTTIVIYSITHSV